AAERATAEHGRGDCIELVEVAEVARLGRIDVENKQHAAESAESGANDISQKRHPVHIDAAISGSLRVVTESQKIPAIDRLVEKDRGNDRNDDQNQRSRR